jgi:hypothetical protein
VAAASAAREEDMPAVALGELMAPGVEVGAVAREAVSGVVHSGDVAFGPRTGAIGVGKLDPRISSEAVAGARAAAQDLASGGAQAG